ncbi:neuropeptide FF receptor 2-like [Branchiostoma floridae]|uniref:Neuropeptide FF receptor 2-like n=1 Tax=Branchiostoma floridae TaxID=7739 RepID=A0A9J7MJR1_BRAFL|nr:neuropeptide FF receptor 2-like [Branchiostoma floridae]
MAAFDIFENSTDLDQNDTVGQNLTDDVNRSTATRLKQSVPVIALFGVSYFLIFALCVVGNTLVCFVVIKIPRMRTVTNYFILNLAVSDLLVGIFCMPATLADNVVMGKFTSPSISGFLLTLLTPLPYLHFSNKRSPLLGWPFGDVMCRLVPFMSTASVVASVFTLLAIAVDRFYAVVLPTKPKLKVTVMTKAVITIWMFAITVSLPLMIFNRDEIYEDVQQDATYLVHYCDEQWPTTGSWTKDDISKYYSFALFIICYLAPLSIILVLYMIIGYQVWYKSAPGQRASVEAQNALLKKKIKVIKMLIVVVVLFALFWLPLHTIMLLNDFTQLSASQKHVVYIYAFPIAHWLSYFNSSVNPIIYGYFNPNFRQGFKSLVISRRYANGLSEMSHTTRHEKD